MSSSAPANTGPAVTDYDVQYRRTADSSWWTHPFTGTTTSTQITGLDRATEYEVQVRAINDEGTCAWSTSTTATTANRAPSFLYGATTTRWVVENAATDQNIGLEIGATDPDGDTLTYSISGTDAASFTIDSAPGQLKTSAPLDYESTNSYSVTVEVSDGQGGTDSIAVTVNVSNLTEPPGRPSAPTVSSNFSFFTLSVSWSPPANTGPAITDYDVLYKRVIDSSWSDHTFNGTTTSTQITGLQAATAYDVQVRATNGEATSIWSPSGTASTGS